MTPLHADTAQTMHKMYPFLGSSRNTEIRFTWYQLCIQVRSTPCPGHQQCA